jgi:hypothetical protein
MDRDGLGTAEAGHDDRGCWVVAVIWSRVTIFSPRDAGQLADPGSPSLADHATGRRFRRPPASTHGPVWAGTRDHVDQFADQDGFGRPAFVR